MPDRCSALLIGNSRWHWADRCDGGWRFEHTEPDPGRLRHQSPGIWASVGPHPREGVLDLARRLTVEDVPLKQTPPWLGVDRALAGWRAWQLLKTAEDAGVIVADAGTVLSLTRVSSDGAFAGGQLAPGLSLQCRAMVDGTRDLVYPSDPHVGQPADGMFPMETAAAMRRGVLQASVGMLLEAQAACGWPLWLCGGDAPLLMSALEARGAVVRHLPDLVMEGLVALGMAMQRFSSDGDPRGSGRP